MWLTLFRLTATTIILGAITGFAGFSKRAYLGHSEDRSCTECLASPA